MIRVCLRPYTLVDPALWTVEHTLSTTCCSLPSFHTVIKLCYFGAQAMKAECLMIQVFFSSMTSLASCGSHWTDSRHYDVKVNVLSWFHKCILDKCSCCQPQMMNHIVASTEQSCWWRPSRTTFYWRYLGRRAKRCSYHKMTLPFNGGINTGHWEVSLDPGTSLWSHLSNVHKFLTGSAGNTCNITQKHTQ